MCIRMFRLAQKSLADDRRAFELEEHFDRRPPGHPTAPCFRTWRRCFKHSRRCAWATEQSRRVRLECNCRCEALYMAVAQVRRTSASLGTAHVAWRRQHPQRRCHCWRTFLRRVRFFGRGLKGSGGLRCGLLKAPGLVPAIRGAQAPDGRFREDLVGVIL